MSWLDLNDYVTLEAAAQTRLDDLFKRDTPRRIDEVIDFFGEVRATPARRRGSSDSRPRGWHPACVLQGRET